MEKEDKYGFIKKYKNLRILNSRKLQTNI